MIEPVEPRLRQLRGESLLSKKQKEKKAIHLVLWSSDCRVWTFVVIVIANATGPAEDAPLRLSSDQEVIPADTEVPRAALSRCPSELGLPRDLSDKLGIWRKRRRDEERGRAPGRGVLAHIQPQHAWRRRGTAALRQEHLH